MMPARSFSLVPVLVTAALAACSETVTTPGASGGTTSGASTSTGAGGHGGASTVGSGGATTSSSVSGSGTGGAGDPPTNTVTLSGQAVRSPLGGPLPGVTVCIYEEPAIPCVQTDAQGAFSIPVPSHTETAVTLAGPGSGSVILPFVSHGTDLDGWRIGMPSSAAIQGFYDAAGATYPDATNGFLEAWIDKGSTENPIDGIPISLSPASGVGPFYGAPGGAAPDPTLQATSSAGFARFAQVAPGVVAVVIEPGALSCQVRFGGWPQDETSLRAPVVAGFETHVSFGCM